MRPPPPVVPRGAAACPSPPPQPRAAAVVGAHTPKQRAAPPGAQRTPLAARIHAWWWRNSRLVGARLSGTPQQDGPAKGLTSFRAVTGRLQQHRPYRQLCVQARWISVPFRSLALNRCGRRCTGDPHMSCLCTGMGLLGGQ